MQERDQYATSLAHTCITLAAIYLLPHLIASGITTRQREPITEDQLDRLAIPSEHTYAGLALRLLAELGVPLAIFHEPDTITVEPGGPRPPSKTAHVPDFRFDGQVEPFWVEVTSSSQLNDDKLAQRRVMLNNGLGPRYHQVTGPDMSRTESYLESGRLRKAARVLLGRNIK